MSLFFIFSACKKPKQSDTVAQNGIGYGKAWQSAHREQQLAGVGITRFSPTLMAAFICSFASILFLVFMILSRPPFSLPCVVPSSLKISSLNPLPSDQFTLSLNHASSNHYNPYQTDLAHIVFGIAASSQLWANRQEYVKLWWRPEAMRGFVWLDQPMKSSSTLPPIKISSPTSKFSYTNPNGSRSAIRISRIVSETFRLQLQDVHWFVMGDDDTVFIPENLVQILSKYDHNRYYYIGSISESHRQNIEFSYNMAYGGGGFAISYPLAKALEKMQDSCLNRYSYLFGSDDRLQACMAELGVPLTKEAGFHQFDVYGDASGLLMAHPVTPLISIHHLDIIDPVFPNMKRLPALRHLQNSIKVDPAGFLQQSFCYDESRNYSISVSWGYAVNVYNGLHPPRDLELPSRTFVSWYRTTDEAAYTFSSRPVLTSPCEQPAVFYMKTVSSHGDWLSESFYFRESKRRGNFGCTPAGLQWINIMKEKTNDSGQQVTQRQCCKILKSKRRDSHLSIRVRNCQEGELSIPEHA